MKKKRLFIVLGIILSMLLISTLGIGIYSKIIEPKEALKENFILFNELTQINSYKIRNVTKGEAEFDITYLGQKYKNSNESLDSESNINIDVENKKVSIEKVGYTTAIQKTLEEYSKEYIFGFQKDKDKILNSKNTTIAKIEENNKKYWKYTIKDENLNNDIFEYIKLAFSDEFYTEIDIDRKLKDLNIKNFNGSFEITLFIDSQTNTISRLVIETTDDFDIEFTIDDPDLNASGVAKVKQIRKTFEIKEVNFKDNYKIPENSLLLLLK